MTLPESPTLRQPQKRTIEYVVLTFNDPLSVRHNIHLNPQVRPSVISGAEMEDFTDADYVLFRARLNEIQTSRGFYRKEDECGISLGTGEPGMQLKYRRIETINVPLRKIDLAKKISVPVIE